MVVRVQNLASLSKYNVLVEFIRLKTEQPGITMVHGVNLEVATIDMSNPDKEKLMNEIVAASSQWGMYQIVNHRIPSEIIAEFQAVGKAFFKLPQEEKELINKVSGSIKGYRTKLEKDEEGKRSWVHRLFHKARPPSAVKYCF